MVALPAATGALSKADDRLIQSLADADAFRTWCGAADQAEALEHIHQDGLPSPAAATYTPEELNTYRPLAICWTEPDGGFHVEQDSVGSGSWQFRDGGRVTAYLEQEAPDLEPGPLARTVKNSIGSIVSDLMDLAGDAGYLAIKRLTVYGPYRSHLLEETAQDDSMGFYFDILWGRA